MSLTFEAEISPGMRAAEVVDLAVGVERAGFDRLGISDVLFWPDCWVLLGLCAQATERVQLGTMVTNPYTRHPAVLAAAAATVDDVSGGRAFLGLGVGAGLEEIGVPYERPVATLRDAIAQIRAQLGPDTVPIAIGTRSPQTMRLAGEVADIALVGGRYLSADMAATYRQWLSAGAARVGRTIDDLTVAPRLTLCASEDGDVARASVKRYVAHYLCLIQPDDLAVEPELYEQLQQALDRSTGWYFDLARHDDPAIGSLVSDELVGHFAIAGSPAECAEMLRAVVDLGFSHLSLNLAGVVRPGADNHSALAETIGCFPAIRSQLA